MVQRVQYCFRALQGRLKQLQINKLKKKKKKKPYNTRLI